jgi:hypothetical protein
MKMKQNILFFFWKKKFKMADSKTEIFKIANSQKIIAKISQIGP